MGERQPALVPRINLTVVLALSGLLLLVVLFPLPVFLQDGNIMPLWLHSSIEIFSITVSMMAFATAWNAHSSERPAHIMVLGCTLLAVGLLDLAHMLSYRGMPDFIISSEIEQGINFWLAARLLFALTLLFIALNHQRALPPPRQRYVLLAGSLVLTACIFWLGLLHQEMWPRTFIQGKGLTTFKIAAEYVIATILLVPAILFYRRARLPAREQDYDASSLFAAAAVTALSEVYSTQYQGITDMYSLLGHIYQVIAYLFIYRAVFVSSVREPFENLALAMEKTAASERLLHAILDSVPLRIFWKDINQRYLGANRLFLRDAGMQTAERLVGRDDYELFPEHAEAYRATDRRVMSSALQELDFEEPIKRVDGSTGWILTSKVPLYGVDSRVTGLLGVYVDITARRQMEESLREQKELFNAIFESEPECVKVIATNGKLVQMNRAGLNMLEVDSFMELQDRNLVDFILPDYREPFIKLFARVCANETGTLEFQIKGKRGTVRWMETHAAPLHNAQGKVVAMVGVTRDVTARKEAEKATHFLAYHDALTGLPNRRLLHDRIEQMIAVAHRNKLKFAVLFLDLNRFKYVNDSLGHAAGDQLLQLISQRLQTAVRDSDTVSRVGGDEFIVVLNETNQEGAARAATKLLQAVTEPCTIDNTQVIVNISMGISIFPDNAQEATSLIQQADLAMYHTKKMGRDNFQFYNQAMDFHAKQIFSMENDLRLALERKEFSLHYQPQLSLRSGKICGAEALIRWNSPGKGFISPEVFIPVAEETGQILAIGEWVLNATCSQLVLWRKQGLPVFPVAVNLSIRQLRQADLYSHIAQLLRDTGLHPHDLELEITEGIMLGDAEFVTVFWKQMQELGVQLSIDDFGTGYSSLSYLKRLPVDKLKIDQSFVHDIEVDSNDDAIVRSIIGLGHQFNLKVIAEGVETLAQMEFLRANSCDEIQGYYFSRPLPAEEFVHFVTQHSKTA